MNHIIEFLSPLERKILPYLKHSFGDIQKKTGLDETSLKRALAFLENKKIITTISVAKTVVTLGVNGVYYKKHHLPERRLLIFLEKNNHCSLEETKKSSGLSDNELKAALGALKRKAIVELTAGKLTLKSTKEEISNKSPEEKLIDILPKDKRTLNEEELYALKNLEGRKDIVEIVEKKEFSFEPTELGKKLVHEKIDDDLIEELTPDMIREGITNKKFRRYDITTKVPHLSGGKRHFVNQARDYARKIWVELGFKEMDGPLIDTSFWVFDSLFTAQDHQVRDMQDSFYLNGKQGSLPSAKIVAQVKEAHEHGVEGSTGWQSTWSEDRARQVVMRTHTTSLSAHTLANLTKKEMPAKFFAIGKAFRNETIDWSHGIEFFQTEGIVASPDVTLSHLFGYLREFYTKMGFKKIRFRPSFFPYTEPSVEIDVYHAGKGCWLELGGAGILRPEVTLPLLGKAIPVLAWGQGLDRMIMDSYAIKDLRELYANDISQLRSKKIWVQL